LVIGVFLLVNGLFLWVFNDSFNILNAGFADLSGFFYVSPWLFLFLIPAITMKSFADEYSSGTIEILKTKPISNWQIVLGKFFASLLLVIIALIPTFIYVYSINKLANPIGNIDIGSILGSYFGLLFLATTYTAVGLFTSTLSKNQIVAFILGVFITFLLFYGFDALADLTNNNTYFIKKLGINEHFKSISRGVVDTRDLIYFISITLLFLFITKQKVNNEKKTKQIAFLLFGVLLINFVGNKLFNRFDLTQDKRYTLSPISKNIVNDIDGLVLIKVYLEGDFPSEFERLQIETRQFLEELQAENSNIRVQFINPDKIREKLIKQGMMPSQLTVEEDGKLSEAIIFPWAQISSGKKTALVSLLPNTQAKSQEEQLQNAVASLEYSFANGIHNILKTKQQKIAVLSGNGELQDIELYSFLSEVGKKYKLAKFTLDSVASNPQKTVEDLQKYDLAIIAKPTEKFTSEEKLTVDQFISNGGKSVWMIDNIQADTDSLYNAGEMLAYPRELELTDLLFSYGVRINNKLVQDLYASQIPLATGNIGNQPQFKNLDWFYHPLAQVNPKHPITKNVLPVRFRFATEIDTLKNNIKKTPLLVSSVLTKLVGTPKIIELSSIANEPKQEEYNKGNQLLAVLLEGKFNSAYKSRIKPFKVTNFKEQSLENKMVVIADGDIARNQTLKGKPHDLGTDKWTNQRFGNKDFLVNTIDYLLDDNGLIQLRNKSVQLNLLNKQKAYSEKTYWQFINIGIPLLLLTLFGLGFSFWRKRKYT